MEESKRRGTEVGELDPRYECPICLSCLRDPLLTSCGHRFCSSCLTTWLENKRERCPVDGAKLDRNSDVFRDHFTQREINNQRTVCRTCKLEMSLNEVEEHMLSHSESSEEEEKGKCPFKSIGCEAEVAKDKVKEHLEKEIHSHLCLVKNAHEKLCENFKSSDKMGEALAQEAMMWEPQEKRKQQDTSLMRALYERVVVLEQRCHEQNAQIEKLKAEVEGADAKIREVSLQHACGQYLWRFENFSQKIAEMKSGRMFFSEHFYTSPIGYKICGRINLSPVDKDQLALLIHLMKGPYDPALEWPFTGRIHLAVIHPTDSNLSVKETMMTRPDLDAFKRPPRNLNTKAFGYPRFMSVDDILNKGFLTEDTLLLKMHIQCV